MHTCILHTSSSNITNKILLRSVIKVFIQINLGEYKLTDASVKKFYLSKRGKSVEQLRFLDLLYIRVTPFLKFMEGIL